MHFVKMLVSLKDGRQKCREKKVRRQGWIICRVIESKGKGTKEQLKNLSNVLKQTVPL